jgi:hypothetical protein
MVHYLNLCTGFPQLLFKKTEEISILFRDRRLLGDECKVY